MSLYRAYSTIPVVKFESPDLQPETIAEINEVSGMAVAHPGPNRSIYVTFYYGEYNIMNVGDFAVWTYDSCHVKDSELLNYPLVVSGDKARRYFQVIEE